MGTTFERYEKPQKNEWLHLNFFVHSPNIKQIRNETVTILSKQNRLNCQNNDITAFIIYAIRKQLLSKTVQHNVFAKHYHFSSQNAVCFYTTTTTTIIFHVPSYLICFLYWHTCITLLTVFFTSCYMFLSVKTNQHVVANCHFHSQNRVLVMTFHGQQIIL
jgi:hypothetical protein